MKFPDPPERKKEDVWYGVGITLGALFFLPVMFFVMALVKAYVLSTLWHWYIVKFFNQPELPLAISFGIGLIITYLIPGKEYNKNASNGEKLLFMIFLPLFTLLLGWLGTFFI